MKKQKKMNLLRRTAALGIAGVLVFGSLPVNIFAEEDIAAPVEQDHAVREIYHIKSAADLISFAQGCKMADFSKNLEVSLDSDIDLSGVPEEKFTGITSFSGNFQGNGHRITGFQVEEGSDAVGFFQYLEHDAIVQDLHIAGTINCTDSQNKVGGIAGINAGTIRNCRFQGLIMGTGITGGIAGMNGASGEITRCSSDGTISSAHTVGGIVGQNRGVVTDCINEASVNSDNTWLELEDDGEKPLGFESLLFSAQEGWRNGKNIGGIAGWSDGIIAGCSNKQTVGYQHAGKNVGGIVGRQCGEVINCTNDGKVYGKQDVGGIAGQFEPKTSPEDVEEIGTAVNELHDLMNQMIDDMDAMGDDVHDDLDVLHNHTSNAMDTTDDLLDEMRDVVKKNIDVLNDLSSRVDYALHHFSDVMAYTDQALTMLDEINDDMVKIKEDLSIIDKMENQTYDEAKTKRLVLLDGVGGSISSDSTNPAEGVEVTITVKAEKGYQLEKLANTPYGGVENDVTAEVRGGKYTFKMPETNVTISAVFSYVGEYIAESNEGGRISVAESDSTVKIRVLPDDDYQISKVTVGGNDITDLLVKEDDSSFYTATVEKKLSGEPVLVNAGFVKKTGSNDVNIVTGMGGTVTSDKSSAKAGEEVTLTVNTLSGYKLDNLTVNNGAVTVIPDGEKQYKFTMPDGDVDIKASFAYPDTSDVTVYTTSNVGGKVSAIQVPGSNDYRITIVPANGYMLADEGTVLTIRSNGNIENEISKAELTETSSGYSYTLNSNNYTTPIEVHADFNTRNDNSCPVKTVSGTGGSTAVNKTFVKAGDTLKIAVANEAHYHLAKLTVSGADMTSEVVDGVCEYTIPSDVNGDVTVIADFDPVMFVITGSEAGGKAAYAVFGQEVVLTLTQNTGYVPVEPLALKDADGSDILYQKQNADSYVYKFDITEKMKNLGTASLHISYVKQSDKKTVDTAKDRIERQSDNLTSSMDSISNTADKIQEIIKDEYGGIRDVEDIPEDELEQLTDYLNDIFVDMVDAGAAAGSVAADANTIMRVTSGYLDESMDNISNDFDELSNDAGSMNDALKNAGNEMKSIVDYLNALGKLEAVNFSDNFDHNADTLKSQMDEISDILDKINTDMNIHSKKLEDDMRAVNDKMNEVFNLMIDKINNMKDLADGQNLMEDYSAEASDTDEVSKVTASVNNSSINGDRNVGGIVGNIGVEGTDSGDDNDSAIGTKYITRAVLRGCTNNGIITVKNENAGGIAGNAAVGYLVDCIGKGKIFSESGNCLGGIAGISSGTIDGCSSLAVLSGNRYIGGIAGKADKIRNCYSMASILESDGWVGAIAGLDGAEDEESDITLLRLNLKDRIHDNYYVSSKLYGINGVSYANVAEPVTYDTLLGMENVPAAFSHLEVMFVDENENVVKRTEVEYGASLDDLVYPQLKTNAGDYMEWEGFAGDIMEGNVVIQAVPTSNVMILSSKEKVGAKSIALTEGVFKKSAFITAVNVEKELPAHVSVDSVCHMYQVSLGQTTLGMNDVSRLRLLNEEGGDIMVYQLIENGWEKVDFKTIGSYAEVDLTGTSGTFCIVSVGKESHVLVLLIVVCAVIAGILVLAVLRRNRKIGRKKAEQQAGE